MKLFISHSGEDRTNFQDEINQIKNTDKETEIVILSGAKKLWKAYAKEQIRNANLFVVVIGNNTANSKNVKWEIKKAIKYKKQIITVQLKPEYKIPPSLDCLNPYTGEKIKNHQKMTFPELKSFIQKYYDEDFGVFNGEVDDTQKETLLEQYKGFLETSENLVKRRQDVSNFYLSVHSAIVALYTAFVTIASDSIWKYLICLGFAVMGVLLCKSWIQLLRSYGTLNGSKMRIINILEKKLPVSLFDAEWKAQCEKINPSVYVPFTETEVKVPKLFIGLYSFLFIICFILLIKYFVINII